VRKHVLIIGLAFLFLSAVSLRGASLVGESGSGSFVTGMGGPDAYGYYWIDNDSAGGPAYQWIDLTTKPGAVQVQGLADDNVIGPFDLGFDFPYYWYTVDHFFIGSNGYMSFTDRDNFAHPFTTIPNTRKPNNMLCPLAGDTDFSRGSGECWYWSDGSDSLVVSWINVSEWWPDPHVLDSTHTFQVILTRPDSNFYYMYGEQHGHYEAGYGYYVIGMEDVSGTVGLQYCKDGVPAGNVFHDGLATRWYAEPDPTFEFHDVGIHSVMVEESRAQIAFTGDPVTLRAEVRNYGNRTEGPFNVEMIVKDPGGTVVMDDTVEVASIEQQTSIWVDFSPQLTTTVVGEYSLEARSHLSDQVPGNNRKIAELRSVDFGGMGTETLLLWDDETLEQYTGWQGDSGGFANEFDVPQEPFKIKEVYVPIQGISGGPDANLIVRIYDQDEYGNPGDIIAEEIIWIVQNPSPQWIVVDFSGYNIVVDGTRVWVAGLHTVETSFYFGLDTSTESPRSNRGWEYTGTLAPDRDREIRDVAIRMKVEWTRAGVLMGCEALTPVFCRGKHFYFDVTVNNTTGGDVSGILNFTGYAGYDCDPLNTLVTIPRNKTFPPGVTTDYYLYKVPNSVVPGQYSASIGGTLSGNDVFCCMNLDIIQCSPFRTGGNTEWDLVEVGRGEMELALPAVTTLAQNYPNPFNATTKISYDLATSGNVSLKVYDISGRLVETLVDRYQEAGSQTASWDASGVSSGVYFYKLVTSDYSCTKKMNLLR
jgi:hypothetical protein